MLKSRALRWLAWALLAMPLLVLLAWLALPPLLKWQLESRGSQALGRELRVGAVEFSPLTLALTLHDLSIGAAPGATQTAPQLQVQRLFVDIDARSLLRLAPVVEAIAIDAPRLRLTRLAEGHYDIDDLLQRFSQPTPQPAAEPARFALYNLRLTGGEISFDDLPVARRHELRSLELGLPFLSNLPDQVEATVEPRLSFVLNGSGFDSHGQSKPFAQGRHSSFELRFDQLDLQPWWAYLPKGLPLRPVGGKLWADLSLRFEQHEQAGPRVELRGGIDVRELALHTPADAPLLSWQSLRLRLGDVQPLQRRAQLDALHLDGAVLHVRRDAAGRLEVQQIAAAGSPTADTGPTAGGAAPLPPPTPASGAAAAAGTPGWQLLLALLEVNGARVHWLDGALSPPAAMQLDAIDLRLKALRWPVEGDSTLQFAAQLRANDKASGQVQAEGTLSDQQAKITLKAADVELAAAAPYLQQVLRPQASARIGVEGELDWAGGATPRLALALSKLRVDDFKLADQVADKPVAAARGRPVPAPAVLAQWERLELGDVRVDMAQRRLSLGSLELQSPFIALARDAAGGVDAAHWLVDAAGAVSGAPAAPAADAAPPWRFELRDFKLDAGRVRLADAKLNEGTLELAGVRVRAQGLAWPLTSGAPPIATQLSASLARSAAAKGSARAAAARIGWRGRVSPQPAAAAGQLLLERLPVHWFAPYFQDQLPVTLQRLEAGFKGEVDVRQLPQGLSARLRGDALLADLSVLARQAAGASAAPAELVSWNALAASGLDVAVQPGTRPRVEIGALRISDYFSKLEITEEGRFNLQTVTAAPATAATAAVPAASAASAAATADAASAPAPAEVRAPSAMLGQLPIDLVIGSTEFSNGRVNFNDRFIRPNYSAELSELNGRVGRLDSRTRDMATLQFTGRVAGTGLLDIGGSINPTVSPPALDITAKATDIELPGLTPYAAKYAGYPIERGKLSVDVAYKVDADGKLEARNQIVINQLTFGPKSDSPDATKLPVLLAVALLQDRHGVIDLDLPVTGSLSDPQFSVGALIWKVIVNVLTKAVTAPFSLLAGGGGANDLSRVDFVPGTAEIAAASQEAIAKVAKALGDRPALKLSIAATADPVSEHEAMQRAALDARLANEQRRERARGALGGTAADAPLPPLEAEARARLVAQLYDDTKLPDKPRNLIGMAKDIPGAEMEARLMAAVPVDAAAARQLAVQRGRAVREALIAKGLGSERLFLSEPKLRAESTDNAAWVPHAQLTLSVN